MSLPRLAAIAIALASFTVPALAQQDAIGIPGPISFDGTQFGLTWTSHPSETYYKQEYLPAGDTLEAYGQMVMVELLTAGATPKSAAADMVASLEQRRGSDPVLNYDRIENAATGEVLLDFLLSDSSSGTLVVEWNAYRYAPHGDGLMLMAISRRGYGDAAIAFVKDLKNWRSQTIQTLATMAMPTPETGS